MSALCHIHKIWKHSLCQRAGLKPYLHIFKILGFKKVRRKDETHVKDSSYIRQGLTWQDNWGRMWKDDMELTVKYR